MAMAGMSIRAAVEARSSGREAACKKLKADDACSSTYIGPEDVFKI
jgi:hypothetical protein